MQDNSNSDRYNIDKYFSQLKQIGNISITGTSQLDVNSPYIYSKITQGPKISTRDDMINLLNNHFSDFVKLYNSPIFPRIDNIPKSYDITISFYNTFENMVAKINNVITQVKKDSPKLEITIPEQYRIKLSNAIEFLRHINRWDSILVSGDEKFVGKFLKNGIMEAYKIFDKFFNVDKGTDSFNQQIENIVNEFCNHLRYLINMGTVLGIMAKAEYIYKLKTIYDTYKYKLIKKFTEESYDTKVIKQLNLKKHLQNIDIIGQSLGHKNIYNIQIIDTLLKEYPDYVFQQSKFNSYFVKILDSTMKLRLKQYINSSSTNQRNNLKFKMDLSFMNATRNSKKRISNIVNYIDKTTQSYPIPKSILNMNNWLSHFREKANTYIANKLKTATNLPSNISQDQLKPFMINFTSSTGEKKISQIEPTQIIITLAELYGIPTRDSKLYNYNLIRFFFSDNYDVYKYSMVLLKLLKNILENMQPEYYQKIIDDLLNEGLQTDKPREPSAIQSEQTLTNIQTRKQQQNQQEYEYKMTINENIKKKLKPILLNPTINIFVYNYARQLLLYEQPYKYNNTKKNINTYYTEFSKTNPFANRRISNAKKTIKAKYGIFN